MDAGLEAVSRMEEVKIDVTPVATLPGELRYIQYEHALEDQYLPAIRALISKDLSEPYSIYVYRYFLYQWAHLCYMVRRPPSRCPILPSPVLQPTTIAAAPVPGSRDLRLPASSARPSTPKTMLLWASLFANSSTMHPIHPRPTEDT
jgi:hypothetical protein